ncbi:MAG: hypothetical protein HY302_06120 [Opitutae bacterium]|nr:hypothetical protein [Opitutae bacterium]
MENPNRMETVEPHSGQYSLKTDLVLNLWLGVATATYLAEFFLLRRHPDWPPLARGLLALAPFLPGLLYVRSCWRFIRGLDELQQRLQLEAVLVAALGTVLTGLAVNTLAAHGVPLPGLAGGLGMVATASVMFFFWLLGGAVANRRYQ